MNPTRFIFWLGVMLSLLVGLVFWRQAHAYDATFNFTQQHPELVAGWKIKAGPTKSGPYPHVIDCKKPASKADGSYDCLGTGLTANPIYAIAVNYDSSGKESAQSSEATMSITVTPPSNLNIGLKIVTISRINRFGKVVASTTKEMFESSEAIREEIQPGYRNRRGEWVSTTIVALN